MIYLNAEVVSGLGEDTFWTWFKREFPSSSFKIPTRLKADDILLRYSTLGFLPTPGKQVALCWELYPEMKEQFSSNEWNDKLKKIYECARFSTYRTVASNLMVEFYEKFGTVDIIPIGVDTDLFKPLHDKKALRNKFGIPTDKTIGIWCGTTHPMKGFNKLVEFANSNPDIYWIVVWKNKNDAGELPGASNFIKVTQNMLCELLNAADFYLSCGILKPFYMVEWEAMACDLKIKILGEIQKDFLPSDNPRDDIFRLKWDRNSTKKLWAEYLTRKGVTW